MNARAVLEECERCGCGRTTVVERDPLVVGARTREPGGEWRGPKVCDQCAETLSNQVERAAARLGQTHRPRKLSRREVAFRRDAVGAALAACDTERGDVS